jgi:hypothetical protein
MVSSAIAQPPPHSFSHCLESPGGSFMIISYFRFFSFCHLQISAQKSEIFCYDFSLFFLCADFGQKPEIFCYAFSSLFSFRPAGQSIFFDIFCDKEQHVNPHMFPNAPYTHPCSYFSPFFGVRSATGPHARLSTPQG